MRVAYPFEPSMIRILIPALIFALLSGLHGEEANGYQPDLYTYLEGREIYTRQCQDCHGRRGKGDGPWTDGWTANRPRNFRTGVFKFRTTPVGYLPTDEDLKRTIQQGISGTAMPVFKGHLTERQLDSVIAYIKCFSDRWEDRSCHTDSVELPEAPNWLRSEVERQDHLENGRLLFSRHCSACHGEEGDGKGAAATGLVDIWGFAIEPADLTREHYKSGDRAEAHFRTIALGLDGTPMAGFMEVLSEDDIWDLVAYLAGIREGKGKPSN